MSDNKFASVLRNWELLAMNDPEVANAIFGEEKREIEGVELIPSENYTYPEVLAANGCVLTNKYSEGYPGKRFYGGQEFTDIVETLAIERAKKVFRAEHANVQALSGSPMNQAVYLGLLQPGDTILGMDLSHGGHLTHGHPVSHMSKIFNFVRCKSHPEDKGRIDFEEVRAMALEHKPKMILCGFSSYPRNLDFAMFKRVADEVGALTMADMAHIGGLIAGNVLDNPLDFGFDIMTTTTHKSLRGPRGALILCREPLAKAIDKSVFPGLQGGPHMQTVASIAITLEKALQPEFKQYAEQILKNAQIMAQAFIAGGSELVTGGTDNHMCVLNTVQGFGIDGDIAEKTLDKIGITVNKQMIPDDSNPPMRPSGIRFGTPACTTRGMKEPDMQIIVDAMIDALKHHSDDHYLAGLKEKVKSHCLRFPVPGL